MLYCYWCDREADREVDGLHLCAQCALAYLNDPGAKRLMQAQLNADCIQQQEIDLADDGYRRDLMSYSDCDF